MQGCASSNLPVHRLDDDAGDLVGVGVGSRSSVLKVALSFLRASPRNCTIISIIASGKGFGLNLLRTEEPRLATPQVNLSMLEVS